MLKKISIILSILSISSLSFSLLNSEETPVIVISPGKTIQSLSTVGSTVEVIDGETINNSTEFTIAEIIDGASIGSNFFQMGGHGTNTAIQLRGLEKRYSTVYIDGIKMMDPSSADGSFYLENVMKNGIDRVEILKGNHRYWVQYLQLEVQLIFLLNKVERVETLTIKSKLEVITLRIFLIPWTEQRTNLIILLV